MAREKLTYHHNYATEIHGLQNVSTNSVNEVLLSISSEKNESLASTREFLQDLSINLEDIDFQNIPSESSSNPFKILNNIGTINFNKCTFRSFAKELVNKEKASYKDCFFKTLWRIKCFSNGETVYINCQFEETVSIKSSITSQDDCARKLFANCNFKKILEIDSIEFHNQLFDNNYDKETIIGSLKIVNCRFNDKFVLNKSNIGNFYLENCEFELKFEFKNNIVNDNFEIINTNFSKLVDMHGTKFHKKFEIRRIIFSDLVVFEKCEYGISENLNPALFEYVTFQGIVNFRNTKFVSGLNIENINAEKSMNFLNAYISFKNSNRETFRIIKYSFDNIGNFIEANKYFVKEMNKYKDEVAKTGKSSDKLLMYFNRIASDFGASYWLPLTWIGILAFTYYLLQLGNSQNLLYKIFIPGNEILAAISYLFNNFALNLKIPFINSGYKVHFDEGMEFLNLMYYILNSILIWLTIVALKRRTKR